jgi:uncharacterized protein (TIGR03437 family)
MSWKVAGLLFAFAALTAAAPPSEPAWQLIGQIGGPTQAVAAQGNHAYVGVGQRLIVLDVTDPTTPREVGSSAPFADFVRDIAVSGTVAYVAAGGAGLHVLDVSDPAHPAEIGAVQLRGYAEGVAVSGTTVCLADGPYGLRVIDVLNPRNPTEVGSAFTRDYALKVAMAGHYAYVAAAGAGLLIADLTNPAKPSQVATFATPGRAYGLAVNGNTVYVAGGWEGLAIVDVTAKATPRLLGQYRTEGWAMGVSVSGTQAYVAAALGGLIVVDVSSPAAPSEIGSVAVVGGDAAGVAVAGAIAYVADRNWGLEAVDLSVPASPAQVGFYGPLGFAGGITAAGNYAYVATGSYGLRIVDISNPAQPRQVGAYDTQSYFYAIAIAGKYVYLDAGRDPGQEQGLLVLDVSDPTRPTRAGFLSIPSGAHEIIVAGGIAYILEEAGLYLVNVSDPTAPKLLSYLQIQTSDFQSTTTGLAVVGNVAYVSISEHGLLVIDVSNPSAPAVMGRLQWPNAFAFDVAVANGKAFMADNGDLTLVDVSNPRAPVWLASYPTYGFEQHVALDGSQAFVANGGAGVSVIDVSTPGSPALAWSYQTLGYAESLFVRGDVAFVADSAGGLLVLRKPGGGAAPPGGMTAPAGSYVTAPRVAPPPVRARVTRTSAAFGVATQAATSCVVTSTADTGAGTLRDCLMQSSSGTTITFDGAVFPPGHPAMIAPLSRLPDLRGNVTIDASNTGVILDGAHGGAVPAGLSITSDGNSIKGLQIVHFSDSGITLGGSARNNVIGGSRSKGSGPLGEGNLISGNGNYGIIINGPLVGNTTVIGNFIGTDIAGTAAMGNQGPGILVFYSPANTIGGSVPEERNVISGNSGGGIVFLGSGSAGNSASGNYIGVDASGTRALGNGGGMGIGLESGTNGSLVQGNVIVSTSSANCIVIYDPGSYYNTVVGNLLGTDADGRVALGSPQSAINVGGGASFNRVGGTTPADRNVIAQGGVALGGQGGTGNLVIGNFIGTDISGSIALAQSGSGIGLAGDSNSRSFIGGTTTGERNVISGNPDGGVKVGATVYAFIGGNYIGTDASGQIALGNGSGGIQIDQGTHVIVQGNLIAHHNPGSGIVVSGHAGNTLRQNLIYDNTAGGIHLPNGANAGVSAPVIASASATGVSGNACPGCEVEIFSDSDDQGRVFEGSAIASASGAFKFDEGSPLTGPNLTATATDGDGNTSEFSFGIKAVTPPANPPPVIAIAPSTLQFAYTIGGAVPAGKAIQVTKTGGGEFDWSASSSAPWLSATPTSGLAPSTLTVSVAPAGLGAGTYSGTITISAAAIASQAVVVTLTVGAPVASISGVVNAASFQPGISPGAWISIFGANLAATTRSWRSDEIVNGLLPTRLDGVSVTIDGKPAAVCYISPTQVNVQVPDDGTAGPVPVQVTAPLGTATAMAQMQQFSPGLISFDGKYVAALHADYTYVGKPDLLPGALTTPARPGEVLLLWGTGFGPSSPATPAGQLVTQAAPLANRVTVLIGGVQSDVPWAGISGAGLWQFNVVVPDGLADGDATVVAGVGGVPAQAGAYLTVQR